MIAIPNLHYWLPFSKIFLFTAVFTCLLCLTVFRAQAQIGPGDLAVVGVVADNTNCSGNGTEDLISFICFQDIVSGTVLDLTDNGWERANPDLFGDSEGTVRMTYAGATIPKGTVITISAVNSPETYDSPTHPGWSFVNINTGGFAMNLNSGGDQLFFMSGGNWDVGDPTPNTHDASYSGDILYGFNTASVWAANGSSQQSNLHPDLVPCYHLEPATGQTDYLKYTGPLSPATQLTWIQRLENSANWSAFPDCATYGSLPAEFEILPSGMSIECTGNCSGCAPVNATLVLNLPPSGSFNVTYTNGTQNFNLPNAVNGQTINVSVNTTTTFSLVSVTSPTGCPVYSSFEGEAIVEADMMPDLSSVNNNSPICEGETLQLDAPYFDNANYDWSGPVGFNSALEDPQIGNATPFLSGTYTLTVSVNGCNSNTVSTQVNILPAPDANDASLEECSNGGVAIFDLLSLNNTITGGQPGTSVAWFTDAAGDNPIANPGNFTTSSTTVYAFVSDGSGCDSEPAVVTLYVTPPTAPQLGTATVCQNSGLFNLNTLLDPNLSAGTWSGTGVSGTNFNPAGLSGNITLTFTPSLPCTTPGTTTITVNVPAIPNLATATLCQNNPPYSLNNLLDPAFPTGSWSGQGVSGNFFNPAGLSGSVTLTFTPAGTCNQPGTTQVAVNVPTTPVLDTATLCQNDSPLALSTLQDPGFPSGNWSGQGVTGGSFNPAGLSGNVMLTFTPSGICANAATTMVAVSVPQTPQLSTAALCETDTIFNLSNLTDVNFPAGTWSGTGVSGGNFNPAGQSGNVILTFTPSATCANVATTTVAVNVSQTPQLGTATLCETDNIFNLSSLADANFPAGTWSGAGVSGGNFDPAGQAGIVTLTFTSSTNCVNPTTTALTVNAPATPQLGTSDLCQNTTPFALSTLADPNFPAGTWSGQGVSGGIFNPANLSGNVALTFTPSATCTQPATTQVAVNTPPTFSNLLEDCDAATQTYTVSFNLSGGDPASYTVNGSALGGSVFTSAPIASGGSYTLNIDDANGCGPIAVNGSENCQCATDAGTMNFAGSPLQVCNGSNFTVDHNLDEFLDADDVLQFVLHDNPGATLGNVLATSNSSTFSFPAGAVLGQTYYVSPVAGTNDGAGNFSPGDGCLSVSQGVPVVFYEPTLQVGADATVCPDECFDFTFQFTGVAPFSVEYNVLGPGVFFSDAILFSGSNSSLNFCPGDFGIASGTVTVEATGLFDGNNCVIAFNPPILQTLTVQPSPVFDLSPTLCPGENLVVNGTIYDAAHPTGSETFIGGSHLGCDSTVNVSLAFASPAEFNLTQTLCTGGSVTVNGTTYNAANPTGTEILTGASAIGCDSTVYIALTFNSIAVENIVESLCPGEFLTVGNSTFDQNTPAGSVTFPGGSYLGCDSVVNVNLAFFAPAEFNLTQTLCTGGSVTVNGTTYDEANPSGTEILTGGSHTGCDSVIHISLTFNNVVIENLNQQLCSGDFLVVNGTTYDETNLSGSELFPGGSFMGCDSVVNISLAFLPPAEYYFSQANCLGGSIMVNGTLYDVTNPTGTETLPGAAANGCDSIVYINLDFNNVGVFNLSQTLCAGEFLFVNGSFYSADNPTGMEVLHGQNYQGCDSVINVSLSFYPPAEYHLEMQLCTGGNLTIFGETFDGTNPTGVAALSNGSANGCDSIVYVNLTFGDEVIVNLDPTLCPGESFFINGTLYFAGNTTGTETFVNGSYLGCDSTVNVNLTYHPEAVATLEQTLPTGTTVVVNGTVYSQNLPTGVEIIAGGSSTGCDSVVFVNLTFVASIAAAVETTAPICTGDANGSLEITAIEGGEPPYVVALDGSNSMQVDSLPLIFNDLDAGFHQLTLQDALGTLSVQEVEIPAPPTMQLDLGDDKTVLLGESLPLSAQANFPVSTWVWSPADFLSCTDCASPTVQLPTDDVTYLVLATDANDCAVEDEVKVLVRKIREVFVPNVFSPNGDGFNDVLTIFAGGQVANVQIFKVFNRWGAVLFEAENLAPNQVSLGWDGTFKGKKMDVGAYVWFAEVVFLDGATEVFEGGVTLVR